jgi:hypothetical protein
VALLASDMMNRARMGGHGNLLYYIPSGEPDHYDFGSGLSSQPHTAATNTNASVDVLPS